MGSEFGLEQTARLQNTLTAGQIQRLGILSMNSEDLLSFLEEEQMSNPIMEVDENFRKRILESGKEWGNISRQEEREGKQDIPEKETVTLQEYLISQIPLKELSKERILLLSKVIEYIDSDTGYFIEEKDTMKEEMKCSKEELDAAIGTIREFEPAGVGAFNLEDSLLIQLMHRGIEDEVLEQMILSYLSDIGAGKIAKVAKKLRISVKTAEKYVAVIKSLNPRPAGNFGEGEGMAVVPDVVAEYEDGKWKIQSPGFGKCGVYLNQSYLKLEQETKDLEAKKYLSDRLRRANEIIEALEQREKTMQTMLQILLGIQEDYARGTGRKKRFTQKEMAERLGVHPSTVQRAVKNKYILLPRGMTPLKELFTSRQKEEEGKTSAKKAEERRTVGKEQKTPVRTEEKVREICLIAPTEALLVQNENVCEKYGKKVTGCLASLPKAQEMAERLRSAGARIFISRKGTKKRLEEIGIPIVEIGLGLSDYIPLMKRAEEVNGKVAFFSYEKVQEDLRGMCYLMGIDASFYTFQRADQCDEIVKKAMQEGAVLGIGGADSARAAGRAGLEHLIVENSEQSLLQAIQTAEQLLELQKEEELKQEKLKIQLERYELVFNYTHDAIIAVDEKGKIDVMNQRARDIIKEKPGSGQMIREIIPETRMPGVIASGQKELNQLMKIGGTMVSTNRIPIVVDGKIKGAVATFQDVKTLQNNEKKIRVKLSEKGLTAKYHFTDIVGSSKNMQNLIRMASKFAKSDATIMIHGETGTGKELFAQSIHNESGRKEGPFVAVNCGSLPKNILEAELFGYVEGAFTGASKGGKTGLFEMAHGGTIFLDEIGEMPLETQVQLLRVLQEKEIRRLGSDRVTPVDIRVITATNRNLPEEIRNKKFREDLYYRLNVLNLEIPPVRERKGDIQEIGTAIYRQLRKNPEGEKAVAQILEGLDGYNWPGNVREIHNLVERIDVLYSQGESMEFIRQYMQSYLRTNQEEVPLVEPNEKMIRQRSVFNGEKEKIEQALQENNCEMTKTAEALGISRSTLWRKIKKYEIIV